MNYWFLDDPARVASERAAIHYLAAQSDWLTGCSWRLDSTGGLSVDFEVTVHGKTFALCMSYPTTFPYSPPFVRPADANQRLSTHQYLDGTLCLEWGPDTWNPELSGVDLIKSAANLLQIENPAGEESRPAPSRHQLTIGQESRGQIYRAFIEHDFGTFLKSLPDDSIAEFEYLRLYPEEAMTVLILSASFQDQRWMSNKVPTDLDERTFASKRRGIIFRSKIQGEQWRVLNKVEDLSKILKAQYPSIDLDIQADRYQLPSSPTTDSFVLFSDGDLCFFTKGFTDPEKLLSAKVLNDESENVARTFGLESVVGKTVGIVGLGSIGSKIAISLAKSGVEGFVLVDDDLVLPGNLVRHTADWTNVGQHKVNAVSDSIKKLRPRVKIKCFRTNLTAQESNAHLNTVLRELGGCDIIIDATAQSTVFNVLAAVVHTYPKPLIWCEIYAGGIGGAVARSRPELDASPQTIRSKFHAYLNTIPKIALGLAKSYSSVLPNGTVSMASDAEVMLIAAHAARLAWDALQNPKSSNFTAPLYLIGLSKEWIFEGPFDTIPLDVGSGENTNPSAISPELAQENSTFIAFLLSQNVNATAAAA